MSEPDEAPVDRAPADQGIAGHGHEDVPAESSRGRLGPGRLRALSALLAALALLLLVGGVVLGVQAVRHGGERSAREAAVQAAEQQAVNVTSLSSNDVEAGLQRVVDGGTGDFKAEYDQQAERLREALNSQEITAKGEVVDSAVVRSDEQSAVVLVVVNGTVANKAQPQAQPRRYRMQVELEHVGDRWLTSSLSID